MQNTFEKFYQICGAYFLIKKLHAMIQKIPLEMTGNMIIWGLYGVLDRYVFSRHNPALSIVKLKSQREKNLQKSSYASAKLLRRDLRNNSVMFKFMHLIKYDHI